jgi:hypothetical protein
MKKLVFVALILWAATVIAGENTCIDSSGNFTAPGCNTNGGISVAAPVKTIDAMTAVGTWAALGNDTTGVATDLDSPIGGGSVEYDKVNGAANTVYGAVTKTLSSVNLSGFGSRDRIQWNIYMSAISNVSYTFVRLGTDASHYNEWRVPVAQLTTGWQTVSVEIGSPTGNTGNGWDNDDIDYVVIGTAHSAETDTLADVRLNNLVAVGGTGSSSDVTIASIVPGTGATDLGKAEDAAHTSGDVGVMSLAVRTDSLGSPLAGTSGDYHPLLVSNKGSLVVDVAANNQGSNALGLLKNEDAAASTGDALVAIGAVRSDALATAGYIGGAAGDYSSVFVDASGALWTHPTIKTTVLTDTATIEAAAYDANDCIMAAAESLTGVAATAPFLTARITDVIVTDLAGQGANLELYIFSADPGAVCAAINSDLDIADDDLAKVQAVIPITTHFVGADNGISTATNLNVKYTLATGTALYYALISRGTPTYASVADLVISIKVELD